MDIRKEAAVVGAGTPDKAQLEKINALAKSPLRAEEVYAFRVRLCDDRPDRDNERFDTAALPRLAALWVPPFRWLSRPVWPDRCSVMRLVGALLR